MSAEWTAVVPARRGSTGIPGKNRKLVGDEMLAERAINRAASITGSTSRVIVTTDDPIILHLAALMGCVPLQRPPALAEPDTTIADAVHHAILWAADCGIYTGGPVAVCQPTSPLLQDETCTEAAAEFIATDEWDSLATVAENTHLLWKEQRDEQTRPLYSKRVNRQFRDETIWQETGGLMLAKSWSGPDSLIGSCHHLYPISEAEALDVDTPIDLATAQVADRVSVIEWRIVAGQQVGYGHLYRCLALAGEMPHHIHRFIVDGPREAMEMVMQQYPARPYGLNFSDAADVVVFDCLVITPMDWEQARNEGSRTIGIELTSIPSSAFFDLYIDELAADTPEAATRTERAALGPRYASIRDEFRAAQVALQHPDILDRIRVPGRILITFGGEDPAGLTMTALNTLPADLDVKAVVGPGFSPEYANELRTRWPNRIIESAAAHMAQEMLQADVVITSAGRTVWESALLGCNIVCIPVNARERSHAFPTTCRRLPAHSISDGDLKLLTALALEDDNSSSGRIRRSEAVSIDGRGVHRVAWLVEGVIQDFL